VFGTTVRVAFTCTLLCLILGFPLAYVLARTQSRFKTLLLLLVVLPLFVGNAVRAAGWMTLFGRKGFLNVVLQAVGWVDQPVEIMFSEQAVIIGVIAVNLPYMVLTLQSVIEGIDRSIEEAAFSLGAAPWAMFRRVLWPLALPGILAGTILTFILAMNAYATPVLLGGPRFKMLAPLVYGQMQLGNWPFGAAVSFILMTTTLVLTVAASYWMQRRYRR
jgi:putative spermidine/putrescine transport system permease protein